MYDNLAEEVRTKTVKWLRDMDENALERWLLSLNIRLGKCDTIE
jgi:hypothetical protein